MEGLLKRELLLDCDGTLLEGMDQVGLIVVEDLWGSRL